MLDNLLRITRMQSVGKTVALYDLAPLIEEIIATTRHRYPHRCVNSTLAPDTFMTTSDPAYVQHIIHILIDNAIAHTPDTSMIEIDAHMRKGKIQLRVCDDGTGVPADQVERIFQPFVTISRGTAHRGSGVGLSMAQAFCHAIDATLHYHNNQPSGACFVITLRTAR